MLLVSDGRSPERSRSRHFFHSASRVRSVGTFIRRRSDHPCITAIARFVRRAHQHGAARVLLRLTAIFLRKKLLLRQHAGNQVASVRFLAHVRPHGSVQPARRCLASPRACFPVAWRNRSQRTMKSRAFVRVGRKRREVPPICRQRLRKLGGCGRAVMTSRSVALSSAAYVAKASSILCGSPPQASAATMRIHAKCSPGFLAWTPLAVFLLYFEQRRDQLGPPEGIMVSRRARLISSLGFAEEMFVLAISHGRVHRAHQPCATAPTCQHISPAPSAGLRHPRAPALCGFVATLPRKSPAIAAGSGVRQRFRYTFGPIRAVVRSKFHGETHDPGARSALQSNASTPSRRPTSCGAWQP